MNLFDDLPEPTNNNDSVVALAPEAADVCSPDITPEPELLPLFYSVAARKGERPEMQDAHVCLDDLSGIIPSNALNEVHRLAYFAVFDGHGGNRASSFAAKRLHWNLASRLPNKASSIHRDIKRIIYDAFKKTDEEFLRKACQQRPHWRDGSTASVVLIVDNTLYVANLGDSKVVLARHIDATPKSQPDVCAKDDPSKQLATICLTRDHNPMDYEERQRIQSTGASVQNGRVNNILEVSRSFGDYQFKKQGVTCIPDIRKYQLTDKDRFLIIACDGLWKSFPPNEAVSFTDQLLRNEFSSPTIQNSFLTEANPSPTQRSINTVCNQLVNEAVLRMSGDNVTCILLVLSDTFSSRSPQADTVDSISDSIVDDPVAKEPPKKVLKLEQQQRE